MTTEIEFTRMVVPSVQLEPELQNEVRQVKMDSRRTAMGFKLPGYPNQISCFECQLVGGMLKCVIAS
jgi:hypothetical protein